MPCGFGRHTLPLARAGYRVVGVDRSATLLDEARRRAGGERWPKLVRADYRELPFADESFDAAFNLFTSLGYLGDEEDMKVLAAIRRVLRPGGKLVIETMHRDRLVAGWSDNDWRLMGEGRLLLEQRTFDPVAGVAQTTQTLIDGRRRARVAHVQRARLHRHRAAARWSRAPGSPTPRPTAAFDGEPLTTHARGSRDRRRLR